MQSTLIRSTLLALIVTLVVAAAFWAGRFTSPAPRFEAGSPAGKGDELHAAFDDLLRAQRETLDLFRNTEFFVSDQDRAEAYRGVLYAIGGALRANALTSTDRPRFIRAVDWSTKSGLDNPDNNYYVTRIRDDASYRISGTRGSTRTLNIQLLLGQPGVADAGTSTNIAVLSDRQMVFDADGRFEIIVSRTDPGDRKNWLKIKDGAETLLVRHTYSDWETEHAGELYIENVANEGNPYPTLTTSELAQSLRNSAVALYDRNATWLKYANMAWTTMPRNGISSARASQGGLVGQYSAFGTWELDDEEALIITTHPTSASYQGIELGNLWFVSLDYESRTSTMTPDQAHLSSDGKYHFVLSKRDPGIQNWLDPEDHERGLIMMRWQGLDGPISDELQPSTKLVSFDERFGALPQDVPRFTPDQRHQQIRERREATHRRFRE